MRFLKCLLGMVLVGGVCAEKKQQVEQPHYRSTGSILRTIRPSIPILHNDYFSHFDGKEKPRGSITTKFFIAPDGRVIESRVIGDQIKDTAFAAKVSGFFDGLIFEEIDRKVIDTVSVPLHFPPRKF